MDETTSHLLRYARGSAQRAATWHQAMLKQPDSLHDLGDWASCQHVSCKTAAEHVAAFHRLGVQVDDD